MNFPALPYSTAYRSQWRQHDGCRSVNTGMSHADDRCQGQRCGGLALRCKAAPAGSRSVRARRSPGARTMAYVSLPGASAFTRLAHSPFGHEFGHFLNRGQVISRNCRLGLTDSRYRSVVAQQFDCCFQRFKILGREQHHVLTAVTSHVDPFMGPINLFGYLGKPSLDFREGQRSHGRNL